jgi:oxaloacetate decarboxylase alpha subunit
MQTIGFVDTTLRDGQESLWATEMRTGMILPVASRIDQAGFEAIEIIATTNFKKTPLRAVRNRYMAAFQITPRSISDLWLERMAANGVRQIRLSDPSNGASHWSDVVSAARDVGLETVINLIFSVSPRHTDEYYAQKARDASKLQVARVCLKDPGGLLTPERTLTLVPMVLQNTNGIPVELHTHCNTGLGPLCCLEAIKLGIKTVNTAIPPLADASSNPSVFNVARNARALGYRPMIDQDVIRPVASHFTFIAKREGLPIGAPVEYDHHHHAHQVPGGMISNLRHQLSRLGMEGRLGEVLEETGRVRAEFAYPIMVTPYSQFVGTQAAMNIILGERYKEVTDEVIQYALGLWGEEESSSIAADVKDKILSRPRARELADWEPPQPSLKKVRQKLGGPGISDDELLLRYFAGEDDVATMLAAGPPKEYVSMKHPLVALIQELTRRRDCHTIHLQRGSLSLRLEKRGSS